MKSKTLLAGAAVLVIGGAAIAPKLASAYRGDPGIQGLEYSQERHETMTQAFENNDYQAWAEQMQGRGRVSEVITEKNFNRFAEAHRLMLDGKTEEAAAIREELGLDIGSQSDSGYRRGKGRDKMMGDCPYN